MPTDTEKAGRHTLGAPFPRPSPHNLQHTAEHGSWQPGARGVREAPGAHQAHEFAGPHPGMWQDQLFWGEVPQLAHILSCVQFPYKKLPPKTGSHILSRLQETWCPWATQDPNLGKRWETGVVGGALQVLAAEGSTSWGLKGLESTHPRDPMGSHSLPPCPLPPPQRPPPGPACSDLPPHLSPGLTRGSRPYCDFQQKSAPSLPHLKSEPLISLPTPSSFMDPSWAQSPAPDKERPRPLPGGSVGATSNSPGHSGLTSHGPGLSPGGLTTYISISIPCPRQGECWGFSVTQAETTTPHPEAGRL